MKKVFVIVMIMAMAVCFAACSSDKDNNTDNSAENSASAVLGIDDIIITPNPDGYNEPQDTLGEDGKSISDRTWDGKTSNIALYCQGKYDDSDGGYESNETLDKKQFGEFTYYFEELSDEMKDGDVCAYFVADGYSFQVELTDSDDGKLTDAEKENFTKWLGTIKTK